jgi:hypothetical protein
VALEVKGNQERLEIEPVTGRFGGGRIDGKILLETKEDLHYHMNLKFKDLNLDELAQVNPAVFGKVKGVMDGTIALQGTANSVSLVDGSFTATRGGKVNASLLSQIVTYIPVSQQRDRLEALIASDGLVDLDRFNVDIKSVSDKKLSLNFDLESQPLNIKPNITLDINLDAGILSLINNMKSLMPKGAGL